MDSNPLSPRKTSHPYNMATPTTTNSSTDKPQDAAKLRKRTQIANSCLVSSRRAYWTTSS